MVDKSIPNLAVLYADVSGSTRLYEEHGDAVARADIALCVEIMSKAAASLGGETLKTIGDEVMCVFTEPVRAALGATEMQAALRKASEAGRFKMGTLHIKIGWHYGKVLWHEDDLLGEAPITAKQVIKLAKADEILTSGRSMEALPPAMFPKAHPIDRIPAEAWDGDLEVVRFPWQQAGDETQVSSAAMDMTMESAQGGLLLDYGGVRFRVDASQPRCRIGRGKDADLRVNGNFTSRQHAEITHRHGRFTLRDESFNGTVIAGDDGSVKRLRREEDVLSGSGMLGFGAAPDDDPGAAVRFRCE